jgi:hypothetical protein
MKVKKQSVEMNAIWRIVQEVYNFTDSISETLKGIHRLGYLWVHPANVLKSVLQKMGVREGELTWDKIEAIVCTGMKVHVTQKPRHFFIS